MTLRELATLIVEILRRRDMMKLCPVTTVTDLHGREVDGVEICVVLAHKLVKVDILRVEPPLFPVGGKVGGDTGVADASVEPNVWWKSETIRRAL